MQSEHTKKYPTDADIIRAQDFIHRHGNFADALLVLGGDKAIWFSSKKETDLGLIMYQNVGSSLVVFKDPVVVSNEVREQVVREFIAYADNKDKHIVFSMISASWMDILHDFGFYFIKFSEEAIIDLPNFTLVGGKHAELRRNINACEKAGAKFEVLYPPHSAEVIDTCRKVSDAWLQIKGGSELQFTACYFSPPYLQRTPLCVSKNAEGKILAFVNLLVLNNTGPATIDFMRYLPDTIKGIMEFTVVKAMLYSKEQGCPTFSLGSAPLVETGREKNSRWVEKLLYRYSQVAENLYNYSGLHKYKAKFHPNWIPRYIAHQRPLNWSLALLASLNAVKPLTRNEKQRIAIARCATVYPFVTSENKPQGPDKKSVAPDRT